METLKATGTWMAVGFAIGLGLQLSKAATSFCYGFWVKGVLEDLKK